MKVITNDGVQHDPDKDLIMIVANKKEREKLINLLENMHDDATILAYFPDDINREYLKQQMQKAKETFPNG